MCGSMMCVGVCVGMVYVCVLCVLCGVFGALVCLWGVSVWCDIRYDGVSVACGVCSVCGMWGEECGVCVCCVIYSVCILCACVCRCGICVVYGMWYGVLWHVCRVFVVMVYAGGMCLCMSVVCVCGIYVMCAL